MVTDKHLPNTCSKGTLCSLLSCVRLFCDPMDCSPPGSSIHENPHAKILEWVAVSFSKGCSWPRDGTWVSCIAGWFFTIWASREAVLIIMSLKIRKMNREEGKKNYIYIYIYPENIYIKCPKNIKYILHNMSQEYNYIGQISLNYWMERWHLQPTCR